MAQVPSPKAVVRAVTGVTVGAVRDAKQDRARNAQLMAELVSLRPENAKRLDESDFRRVGEQHGVPPWKLHAMADIESNRGGFDADGRAIVVPELHQFAKRTAHAYRTSHPEFYQAEFIVPSKVPRGHPYKIDNAGRWDVLARLAALNFDAALESTSWGAFQLMGFHWRLFNFSSPLDLVRALYESERRQLDFAVRLLIAGDGFDALCAGDWKTAARCQNGPGNVASYAAKWEAAADKRRALYT
jgi:hypothetical protein